MFSNEFQQGGSESHSIHCPTKTVVWDCDIGTDHPDLPAFSNFSSMATGAAKNRHVVFQHLLEQFSNQTFSSPIDVTTWPVQMSQSVWKDPFRLFSPLVIKHFLSGLLKCFCTYDVFHINNSISYFWASGCLEMPRNVRSPPTPTHPRSEDCCRVPRVGHHWHRFHRPNMIEYRIKWLSVACSEATDGGSTTWSWWRRRVRGYGRAIRHLGRLFRPAWWWKSSSCCHQEGPFSAITCTATSSPKSFYRCNPACFC